MGRVWRGCEGVGRMGGCEGVGRVCGGCGDWCGEGVRVGVGVGKVCAGGGEGVERVWGGCG